MGPRSDERGNGRREYRKLCESISLQWGRARMSAEITYTSKGILSSPSFNGAALG